MLSIIGSIVGGIFGAGKQYLSNRAEKAQAKHEREVMVIKGEQDWEEIQAEASKDSWKDEFLTVVTTAPFILMFGAAAWGNEEMVARFKEAFLVLKTDVPAEYWYLLGLCYAASFGIKSAAKFFGGKK